MPPRTAPAAPAPSAALAVAKAKMQEKHAAQRKRFHEALGTAFDSADDFDLDGLDLDRFDFNDPTEMDLLFKYPIDTTDTTDIAPNSPKRFCSDTSDSSDPSDNNDSDNDSSASSSSTSDVWPFSDSDLDELCDLLADVSDTELDVMTANLMNTTITTLDNNNNNNNDMTTDELPPIPPTPPPSEGTATEPPLSLGTTRYDTPEPTPPAVALHKSKFLESLGPNVKLIRKLDAKRKMITTTKRDDDDDITQIVPFKEMRIHDVKTAALRIAVLLDLDDQLHARPSPGEMLRNWCEGNDAPPLGSRNMRAHMRFIRTNGDFCKYMAKKTVDVFPPEFKTRVDECEAFLRGMPDYTPQVVMV